MATTSPTHDHARTAAVHVPVRRRRAPLRTAAAIAAGLVVASAVAASAAGLTAGTDTLGATTQAVSACDPTGVTVTYGTTYASGGYNVTTVSVNNIAAACNGRTVGVTLTGASGSLGAVAFTGPLSGMVADAGVATGTVTGTVTAASVTGISVVIA